MFVNLCKQKHRKNITGINEPDYIQDMGGIGWKGKNTWKGGFPTSLSILFFAALTYGTMLMFHVMKKNFKLPSMKEKYP